MRRVLLSLLALAALAAPVAAHAKPAPPDPVPPALRGTPALVADGAHRVTLHVRFDRVLALRFDGEPLATAAIGGRIASLAPAPRRPGRYEGRGRVAPPRAGRPRAGPASGGGGRPPPPPRPPAGPAPPPG